MVRVGRTFLPESHDSGLRESRNELIAALQRQGILKSRIVREALISIPREEFLWMGTPKFLAYEDEPQSLGDTEQTISAPHMVVIMLEELELSAGLRILEIGAGSGYNAALLGWICSQGVEKNVLVTSVERDERLADFARKNIERVGLSPYVEIVQGDGSLGYPQEFRSEIYDRITVAAGADRIPYFLKVQLKTGGIMEVPVGGSSYQKLLKIKKVKLDDGTVKFMEKRVIDCMFVPLVSRDE